jgi:hypothetical protein
MKKEHNIIIVLLSVIIILILFFGINLVLTINRSGCKCNCNRTTHSNNVCKCLESRGEGTITKINRVGEYGTILIEKDNYKALVTINKNTMIIKTVYSRTFAFSELNIGDEVEVIFDGVVADSYPLQGIAKSVYITK